MELTEIQSQYENAECPECGEPIPDTAVDGSECVNCGYVFYIYEPDEYDQFRDDVDADADALRCCGWGTDEDYGYYGDE